MLLSPAQMHIPDGFLSILVSVIMWLLTLIVVSYALKRAGKDLDERQVPLMGVLAAAIFAGQMLNFTIAGGTSGHLMGAAIATILLGPWPAVQVMTCVVAIQALIFQDGGLLVLGANIFNMGIIGVAVAYMTFRTIRKLAGNHRWGVLVGGFIAAWLSILLTSLAVALQLSISGTSPANITVPAMGGIHALIGIGEGLITMGALSFITATRPDLLNLEEKTPKAGNLVWAVGLLLTLVLIILSPLASANPDGLERVAEQQGFLSSARVPLYNLVPDYLLPGITDEALATILASLIGALIVLVVILSVGYLRRKRQQPR